MDRHPRRTSHSRCVARSGERRVGTGPRTASWSAEAAGTGSRGARYCRADTKPFASDARITTTHDGVFYRPFGADRFVVVGAPRGARIRVLPFGYVSFFIGPRRYFLLELHVLLVGSACLGVCRGRRAAGGGPSRRDTASESGGGDVFVYPKEGQTDEQRDPRPLRVLHVGRRSDALRSERRRCRPLRSRATTGAHSPRVSKAAATP